MFLELNLTSSEKLVGTPDGMLKVLSEENLRARDGMQDGLKLSDHARGNHTSNLKMTKC